MDHLSAWQADIDIPSRPALAGDVHADVLVVGAGITGMTAALLAQRDGADVVVLEGRRIAGGSTGRSTGKVTSQHTLFAADMIARHGEDTARLYAQANQAAVEQVAALAGELGIDCHLERTFADTYTTDPARRGEIEQEVTAARRLGLPAELAADNPLPFEVAAAVRFTGQVQLNPAMYVAGLAAAFEARGGRIFEHSRVRELRDRDAVEARAVDGTVTAARAVIATLLPFTDIGGFFAKAQPYRAYGIGVRLTEPPPEGMHISAESPTRSLRAWRGVKHGMAVVGESHKTGQDDDTERHYAALEQWTREHFPVGQVCHRWSAQDYQTIDGLPYVGRCPRTEHVYVATGFAKWGLSNGTAAAAIIADLLAGRASPWLPAFDATRIGDVAAVGKAAKENFGVAKSMVGGRLGRLRSEDVAALAPGQGGIVDVDGQTVAAFRDEHGHVSAVSPTCTHLGCTVAWNGAERSWDCPCHGSRFSVDGAVLDGPATEPLEAYETDPPAR